MSATITAAHVLKSTNQTMTVVVVTTRYKLDFDNGRVLFANSFGEVQTKRQFRDRASLEVFVKQQLDLETPRLHGTIDQIMGSEA